MANRISKISLIVYAVLLVFSGFLLSVAGDYWQWYSIMGVFAVLPLAVGPRRYRILGAVALTLCIVLIAADIEAGMHLRAQRQEIRSK